MPCMENLTNQIIIIKKKPKLRRERKKNVGAEDRKGNMKLGWIKKGELSTVSLQKAGFHQTLTLVGPGFLPASFQLSFKTVFSAFVWHVGWGEVECLLKVRGNQWATTQAVPFPACVCKGLLQSWLVYCFGFFFKAWTALHKVIMEPN